jgi:hypothetical protein
MRDLSGNIVRICDGLAREATTRIIADHPDCNEQTVHSHIKQVLIDWFLGSFIPGERK